MNPEIQAYGPGLGQMMTDRMIALAGGAKSYLAFTNTRGPANAPIMVPLGAATSGRPHHRIGDCYQDLKDLGHDLDNPAAV